MRSNTKAKVSKATELVVSFGHESDAGDYARSVRACAIAATVNGRDVTVALSTVSNNEIARNLVPSAARIFWR